MSLTLTVLQYTLGCRDIQLMMQIHNIPVPLVLGHIEGDLISLMNVSLIVDISEGIRNEEKLSTAFIDDSSHPRVSVGLAGLQGERENRHWDECLGSVPVMYNLYCLTHYINITRRYGKHSTTDCPKSPLPN